MTAFDYILALHCAPTLAGEKPASLISLKKDEWGLICEGLVRSGRAFGGRQVYFRRLIGGEGRVLLLVYRRDLLSACLAMPKNARILNSFGYDPAAPVGVMINRLAARVACLPRFPHEIGVFLGYPPEDVRGFIEQGGKNYHFCGCWKVYGNPAEARRLFSAYAEARSTFLSRVMGGEVVENIVIDTAHPASQKSPRAALRI